MRVGWKNPQRHGSIRSSSCRPTAKAERGKRRDQGGCWAQMARPQRVPVSVLWCSPGTARSQREGASPEQCLQTSLPGAEWDGEKGKLSQEAPIKMTRAGNWVAWGCATVWLPLCWLRFVVIPLERASLKQGHSLLLCSESPTLYSAWLMPGALYIPSKWPLI